MVKIDYDPYKETKLQAVLRLIRESETLEDFKQKKRIGEWMIKELRKIVEGVTKKWLFGKHDAEYLNQTESQILMIQKTLIQKEEELKRVKL